MPNSFLQTKEENGNEHVENEDYFDLGFVGDTLCGEDRTFQEPVPTITLDFSKSFPDVIPGLTITFSTAFDEYASIFRIKAFHSGTVIYEDVIHNSEVIAITTADIRGYDKIQIEILQWSKPYRYARIEDIYMGITKVYTKSDIMSYSATNSISPLSTELPNGEITFSLKNLNNEFNPDNPKGIEKYLLERQQVRTRYGYLIGGEIEWIPGGVFYLSEWETPQNGITASFTARDMTELMTDIYEGPTEGTLYDIAEAALIQADIPTMADHSNSWSIDTSLNRISLPANVDFKEYTIAEVLQLAANAGCCTILYDREGKLHIRKIGTSIDTSYQIDLHNSYKNAEITLRKQLKSLDINNKSYIMTVGTRGETQKVSNDFVSEEQYPNYAKWIADFLVNRRLLSGDFRLDPRLDPLDIVPNINQFSRSVVLITEVGLVYNGAFRGSYSAISLNNLSGSFVYSGEIESNEFGIY